MTVTVINRIARRVIVAEILAEELADMERRQLPPEWNAIRKSLHDTMQFYAVTGEGMADRLAMAKPKEAAPDLPVPLAEIAGAVPDGARLPAWAKLTGTEQQ